MLIPFLHTDPRKAAQLLNRSYVVKLPLESMQCLIWTLYWLEPDVYCAYRGIDERPKPRGHAYHPFVRDWLCKSQWAWDWTLEFAVAGCHEYARRHPGRRAKILDELETLRGLRPSYDNLQPLPPPLPKLARPYPLSAGLFGSRVVEYRRYFAEHKNKCMWQFLYEPDCRRPKWMPPRSREQQILLEKHGVKF